MDRSVDGPFEVTIRLRVGPLRTVALGEIHSLAGGRRNLLWRAGWRVVGGSRALVGQPGYLAFWHALGAFERAEKRTPMSQEVADLWAGRGGDWTR